MTKVIGVLIIMLGILWIWYSFDNFYKNKDTYRWYAISRNFFTGVFIVILGLAVFFGIFEL